MICINNNDKTQLKPTYLKEWSKWLTSKDLDNFLIEVAKKVLDLWLRSEFLEVDLYLIHVYSLTSDLVTVSPLSLVLRKRFVSLIWPWRIFTSFLRVWYKVFYTKKKTIKYSDLQTTPKENMANLSQERLLNQQAFKQIGVCSYQQNNVIHWINGKILKVKIILLLRWIRLYFIHFEEAKTLLEHQTVLLHN